MATRTERAERVVAAHRLRAPATSANVARNAGGEPGRAARWRAARESLWAAVDPCLSPGARVAVLGAGNGDDLPLTRLARRAGEVVLIDVDDSAPRAARRREARGPRRRIRVCRHDATGGAADAIAGAAARGVVAEGCATPATALPGAPYDLIVGDLLYSQLLWPALIDLEVPEPLARAVMSRHAAALTSGVVARMHASAPAGGVLHLHDPLAWWPGRDQPVALPEILRLAGRAPDRALALAARGSGPRESDPRRALRDLGLPVARTALWRWAFAPRVDYLVCATLSGPAPGGAETATSG